MKVFQTYNLILIIVVLMAIYSIYSFKIADEAQLWPLADVKLVNSTIVQHESVYYMRTDYIYVVDGVLYKTTDLSPDYKTSDEASKYLDDVRNIHSMIKYNPDKPSQATFDPELYYNFALILMIISIILVILWVGGTYASLYHNT